MAPLDVASPARDHTPDDLVGRYQRVRGFSERICATLTPEDCTIQSMPDVSPTRWHLAHTTWFFETFLLRRLPDYEPFHPEFQVLFNSYYNAVGEQFPRPRRGLLSRPGLKEVWQYRHEIDRRIVKLLGEADNREVEYVVELGLQHEQQHQELILTDIKHVLSCNPLLPAYDPGASDSGGEAESLDWVPYSEGVYWIGHDDDRFAYDNETPRHRCFLEAFELASRPVTVGEYLEFLEDGGYQRAELWLSAGWQQVQDNDWVSPLYWSRAGDRWRRFTLAGERNLNPAEPVCHVSFFEADAYARWAGSRLPTEAEWEVAAAEYPVEGNFVDTLLAEGAAIEPSGVSRNRNRLRRMYGDVWEWTASPYVAYPGFRASAGALGEYNGKFMCNQFVLRGGSCATHHTHVRPTYRNFFPPEARWQFNGIRLAR